MKNSSHRISERFYWTSSTEGFGEKPGEPTWELVAQGVLPIRMRLIDK
jgi:hypothetical protein